jgi:hypothetical protein
VNRITFSALAMLLALCGAARAQDTPKPVDPCDYSAATSTRVVIAGIDMHDMKCQLFTAYQQAGQLTAQNIVAQSEIAKLKSQLKTAEQRAADLQKYGTKCGDKPGCWAPIEPLSAPSAKPQCKVVMGHQVCPPAAASKAPETSKRDLDTPQK